MLTAEGGVTCWCQNLEGQLGNGSVPESVEPVDVIGLQSDVTAIAAGARHACALNEDGSVTFWGSHSNGQPADETTTGPSLPMPVIGLDGIVTGLIAGSAHTCAVICWGGNEAGQLGDGIREDRPTPVRVLGLGTPQQIEIDRLP
ncbi:MAG: hypothetical protein LBM75_06890 [Myxococcales bacterium]|nr:hypothetical protein [Myxococcales bacterium]